MLGWHISIYRQTNGGAAPGKKDSPQGTRLVVWQTGLGGLDWIDKLVEAGKAIDLGGNGYPYTYTAEAEALISKIGDNPPEANAVWVSGTGDLLTDGWEGKTVIHRAAIAACRPDEWLLLVAWDES